MGEQNAPGRSKSQPPSRRLAQVLLVALLIVPIALWAIPAYQSATYEHDVTLIVGASDTEIAALNRGLLDFGGEPAKAQELEPKLAEASGTLKAIAGRLQTVSPPAYAETYHRGLVALYGDAADYSTELSGVMRFIVERTRLLNEFARSLDTFAATLQSAESETAVTDGAVAFQEDAEATLKAVQALERPEILAYSNGRLERLLGDLSTALASLQAGVEAADEQATVAAIADLQRVLAEDWGAALAEADSAGVEAYAARVQQIEDQRLTLQEFPSR